MPAKTNTEHEAYVERAREARAEQAERLRERPPRREDLSVLRAKMEKRRAQIEASAARGDLRRWAVGPVAELFRDEEIPGLLEQDAEAQEAKAERASRRQEQRDVQAMARQIEREHVAEARRATEEEARRRLAS